jgi:formylglycine-generating enzyme required for sulfatase activity
MNRRDFIKSAFLASVSSIINPAVSSEKEQRHTYESFSIADDAYMLFKLIEPGTFMMGSQDEERQEADGPPHKVTITKPFYIGIYEVTQQQWNKVMKNLTWSNPSRFGGQLSNPVENISWQQANEFLDKLNEYNNNSLFRLPKEAEWEYACRAGTTTRTYWGDDPDHKGAEWNAWLGGYPYGMTHPVGQLNPNAWGLYDMCGNVAEFTQDRFARYKPEDQIDPLNLEGKLVVARGGDWFHAGGVDSETRRKYNDKDALSFLGFRVARDVE